MEGSRNGNTSRSANDHREGVLVGTFPTIPHHQHLPVRPLSYVHPQPEEDPTTAAPRTVLVTGACGLLGGAVVKHASLAGCRVFQLDIASGGKGGEFIACDVRDRHATDRTIRSLNERAPIDAVIHCAGINDSIANPDLRMRETGKEFDDVLQVNVAGTANIIMSCAEQMIQRDVRGKILCLASMYAHVAPNPHLYEAAGVRDKSAAYVASKAAVVALVKYFAVRFAPDGIRINGLSPGAVMQDQPVSFVQEITRVIPSRRMMTASYVAETAYQLTTGMSDHIVGQVVVADGGYSVW